MCENLFTASHLPHAHRRKVGQQQPKNYLQRHASRLLFSIVTHALANPKQAGSYAFGDYELPDMAAQSRLSGHDDFHQYMQSLFRDRGLNNSGLAL